MSGNKILIIEDEPVHLNVMKAKLEFEGYDVLVAMDGEKGYEMIKNENPDLVLLDIILPTLDGFEILEKLKKDQITLPIIVVSNSGQPVEIDKAIKLGAIDYLVKTEFDPADVLEKVIKVLGKSAMKNDTTVSISKTETGTPASEAGIGVGKSKILIVEDDKFLRDLIVQKLHKEGFAVLEAIDGENGIKVTKEKKPDLILLDLILPGLDGFEVMKILKSDPATSQVPIIVLSNLGQKEDMDRALAGGAEDFMVKAHFTPGEIITKIKSVLKTKYF